MNTSAHKILSTYLTRINAPGHASASNRARQRDKVVIKIGSSNNEEDEGGRKPAALKTPPAQVTPAKRGSKRGRLENARKKQS